MEDQEGTPQLQISFALALRSKTKTKTKHTPGTESENLSTANLCGDSGLISYFNFWHDRKYIKKYGIICDSKNDNCHCNDSIIE